MKTVELTNSLLKGVMTDAMVYRGVAKCIEDCVENGIWYLDSSSTTTEAAPHASWYYGWLEVKRRYADVHQRLTRLNAGIVYERLKIGNKWSAWYQVSMQKVT